MFKVLHSSPSIPETLSPAGKDFVQKCFERDPANRPSAAKLLEHAFVQNLHDQDISDRPQLCRRRDSGVSADYIILIGKRCAMAHVGWLICCQIFCTV